MSAIKVPYIGYVQILVHRVLAGHGKAELCSDCPALCRHCGDVGPTGTDHTCPCPNGDECPEHIAQPSSSNDDTEATT